MTIWEFADIIDKQIVITYYPNQDGRFSALFLHGEIKQGNMRAGAYGNGITPMEAVAAYIEEICGERLVFNAMSSTERREFVVPKILETQIQPSKKEEKQ